VLILFSWASRITRIKMISRQLMLLLLRLSLILQQYLPQNLPLELLQWASLWAIILISVTAGIGLISLLLLLVCLISCLGWLVSLAWGLLGFLDPWEVWLVCLPWNCWLKLCLVLSFNLEGFLGLLPSFLLSLLFWAFLYGLVQFIIDVIRRNGLMLMEFGL